MEKQNLRMTSSVEDFHPVLRRRAFTSIRSSFPIFFNPDPEPGVISMNESQRLISQNFTKINNIIDLVDDHIRRRIEVYENEVVSVVQNQIEQMRQQTQKVVAQFNSMIQQKNKENQIWSLNNQLDYFKSEAKKLFDDNRKLRKQNVEMLKKFKEYEWQLENREVIMQKIWYKYQKEKHHKGKLKTMMDEGLQNIQKQRLEKRKLSKPQIMQFSLKDDAFNFDQIPELKLNPIKSSQVFNQSQKSDIIDDKQDQNDKDNIQNGENSLLKIDYEDQSEMSKIQFKCKSLSVHHQVKPQMKDQQLQVNIFLSEHSYKNLFEKKVLTKRMINLTKPSQEIAIQTDKSQMEYRGYKRENQTSLSSHNKRKDIDFVRNGFYVNDVRSPNPKTTQYRSTSTNHNTTKRETFHTIKDKKGRMTTQIGFNKCHNQQKQINTTKQKGQFQNKMYCKMARRLQRNKIVQRAYDNLNKSIEY